MKTANPFMLKETSRAITCFTTVISNLMWYEYENGVPISYLLENYDVSVSLSLRGVTILRIGELNYLIDNKSYNSAVNDLTSTLVSYISNRLSLVGECNGKNSKNLEKFIRDNSELIREWYVESVNA
jgi:hypothetical protein